MSKVLCFIGLHSWGNVSYKERICTSCKRHEFFRMNSDIIDREDWGWKTDKEYQVFINRHEEAVKIKNDNL